MKRFPAAGMSRQTSGGMSASRALGTGCGLLGHAWCLLARPPVQQCFIVAQHGLVGRQARHLRALLLACAELFWQKGMFLFAWGKQMVRRWHSLPPCWPERSSFAWHSMAQLPALPKYTDHGKAVCMPLQSPAHGIPCSLYMASWRV